MVAAAAALELNELPGVGITGAAIVSMGGAFLIPLLHEVSLGGTDVSAVLIVVVVVAFADALIFEREIANAPRRVGLSVLGAAYPGLLLATLVPLRQLPRGEWWIFLAVTVTWLNDTLAYFVGRAFGRRKLYERISPSKTWEGAVGGALGSILGAVAVALRDPDGPLVPAVGEDLEARLHDVEEPRPAPAEVRRVEHPRARHELDDPDEPRTKWLLERLEGAKPAGVDEAFALLGSLLRRHGEEGEPPVCIHRERFPTVSSSLLALGALGTPRYLHSPGPPCVTPYEDHSSLLA